jgi:hypothetical protein
MDCLGLLLNNSQRVLRRWPEPAISKSVADVMNLTNLVPKSGRPDSPQVRILRFFRRLFAGLALASAACAVAQSSSSPTVSPTAAPTSSENVNAAAPSPSASAAVEPPSLIPPNILPGPGAAALPQIPSGPDLQTLNAFFKQTSLGKAADEHRLHLQMSALETRIRNDEDLHALQASANKVRTDLERRHALKAYYKLYFVKLRALASTPELQDYLKAQEAAHEAALLQPRVRHETDEAEAARLAELAGGAAKAGALPTPIQARASDALRNP